VIRTVIADDHQLFTEGLKNILRRTDKFEFQILGEAENGRDLLPILKRTYPDLLLLDLNMPEADGLDVLDSIRENYSDMKILALTMYDEAKLVKSAFKAGVDGYILKNSDPYELLNAIEEVLKGKTYIGVGVQLVGARANGTTYMADKERSKFEDKFIQKYNLTKREIEILKLISQAFSNKEIAQELFISDQTVSVHRKNIMRKLNVSNIAGLIKIAYDNSIV
jgi:DNA-binding NarL/FixJ family response regulator